MYMHFEIHHTLNFQTLAAKATIEKRKTLSSKRNHLRHRVRGYAVDAG